MTLFCNNSYQPTSLKKRRYQHTYQQKNGVEFCTVCSEKSYPQANLGHKGFFWWTKK
jgi:hypothetical protein